MLGHEHDHQHHSVLECPGCGAPVHVVASHTDHRARWVCLACKTVGSAPMGGAEPPARDGSSTPVAAK